MTLSLREQSIITYIRSLSGPTTKFSIDLNSDLSSDIDSIVSDLGISFDEFSHMALIQKVLEVESSRLSNLHSDLKVIDIFDLHAIDNILSEMDQSSQHILLVNIDFSKHSVIVPASFYEKIKSLS